MATEAVFVEERLDIFLPGNIGSMNMGNTGNSECCYGYQHFFHREISFF
jgi:hypothetical protein